MTRTILTYADYAALPDDGRRYELHAGELSMTPAPGTRHQVALARLFDILLHHVDSRGLGLVLFAPLDCILSDTTVLQPDIVFVDTQYLSRISERGIEGAPTLAVEVSSPSTERIDREAKLEFYARHGVANYWIVDPAAREIEARVLEGETYTLAGRVSAALPGALPPFPDLVIDPVSPRS